MYKKKRSENAVYELWNIMHQSVYAFYVQGQSNGELKREIEREKFFDQNFWNKCTHLLKVIVQVHLRWQFSEFTENPEKELNEVWESPDP